jgi:flavorubredoxin
MITNAQSGTRVDEIAAGIYRISTPLPPAAVPVPGGFSFNQFLVADDEPLLFHTGPRRVFPLTREAVEAVLPVESLRWVAFSHYEADECGALNEFLAAAPRATAACSFVAALTSIEDQAIRPPRALRDGEELSLGKHRVRWYDAPHLPHGWECGYLFEATTATLLCGDLFTQAGAYGAPVTQSDILGPSEAMRAPMDYFSHTKHARALLSKLAGAKPGTLACMHGSAWTGDGEKLLGALADALERG